MVIDWKTIISEFDGKPTLLQAIGKLRKAVEDETITIQQAQAEIAKLESQQKADEALIKTAQSTADEAKINAYNASQKGDQALGKATTAGTKAQQALDLATTNETDIATLDGQVVALQAKASIEITLEPETVTRGPLTDEQLATLLLNDNCYIKHNGIIYTLFKRSDTVLKYTAGYLNDTQNIQTIKVLVNSKAWTIENIALPKTKTYKHYVYFTAEFGTLYSDGNIQALIYTSSSTPFTFNDFYKYVYDNSISAYGKVLDGNDYNTVIGFPIYMIAINSKLYLYWFKFSENNIAQEIVTSENCYINDTVTTI